jgi:hypothetical protein
MQHHVIKFESNLREVGYVLLLENTVVKHKRIRAMVFNATFSNISVISWQSALLMEETGLLKETL